MMSTTIEKQRALCLSHINDATKKKFQLLYFVAARSHAENLINRKLYEEVVPDSDSDGLLIADYIQPAQ